MSVKYRSAKEIILLSMKTLHNSKSCTYCQTLQNFKLNAKNGNEYFIAIFSLGRHDSPVPILIHLLWMVSL